MGAGALTISPLIGNDPVAPELRARILELKESLGKSVLILGHHYQRDDVIEFADRRGDSLDLSLFAAKTHEVQPEVRFVVFCGVHFMAETADILTPDSISVLLPDLRAGCTMADMAGIDDVEDAWEVLTSASPETIIPITYINSTAALKAFCGRHGGAVCTSSNAKSIITWAFERGSKLLFFPDQHLGRNTCADLGIPLSDMLVYDPHAADSSGGHTPTEYARAKVVLWKGHCSVHQNFQPTHPDLWRQKLPGIQILVHPECPYEVVQKSDYVGSTRFILETVEQSPSGSAWAIGTEHHLVNRLATENPDKFITSLAPFACQCSTMFRISPEALCGSLESIAAGAPRNVIKVDAETRRLAITALDRMLDKRD